MWTNDFEKAFGDFLERYDYDQAQNLLFTIARCAFEAGWLAAGGEAPIPQKIYEIVHGGQEVLEKVTEE